MLVDYIAKSSAVFFYVCEPCDALIQSNFHTFNIHAYSYQPLTGC